MNKQKVPTNKRFQDSTNKRFQDSKELNESCASFLDRSIAFCDETVFILIILTNKFLAGCLLLVKFSENDLASDLRL